MDHDLSQTLASIENTQAIQSGAIEELSSLLKDVHAFVHKQETNLANCVKFIKGQFYLQNEATTGAIYSTSNAVKFLLEEHHKVYHITTPSL
ncbi:hypothetical protein M5689_024544 [Euphorbia peplus]|nr:hypothetical protein M5689_024544 [Euphorbia peplus]